MNVHLQVGALHGLPMPDELSAISQAHSILYQPNGSLAKAGVGYTGQAHQPQ